jgi:hypothetical protein
MILQTTWLNKISPIIYAVANPKRKREMIGLMYPDKLTFDETNFRTKLIDEAVELIYKLSKNFEQNKKRTNHKNQFVLFLLAYLDSNQDKQNQNLSYYHYTIGQSLLPNNVHCWGCKNKG